MSKATEVTKQYLDYLSDLDIAGVVSLFADDIVQKVPFAPEGTPGTITGKENVAKNFEMLPMVFKSMKYSDIQIVECVDPNLSIAFAHADATLPNGSPYGQSYVFYVHVNKDGKIDQYREYMNTQLQAQALGALGGDAK